MPDRLSPRSTEYAEIDAYMFLLNCLLNPQLFHDLSQEFSDPEFPDETRLPIEGEIMVGKLLDDIQGVIDA